MPLNFRRLLSSAVALTLAVALGAAAGGCATPSADGESGTADSRLLKGRVTYVVDGDTAHVEVEGRGEEKVRFIGIDTPESTKQVEPFGREATQYARSMLDGKTVWLEPDAEERDRYGRLLAYVWLKQPTSFDGDGRASDAQMRDGMYNARVALDGFATQMTIPPNVRYADRFRTYVREARDAGKGLWSGSAAAPTDPEAAAAAPEGTSAQARPAADNEAGFIGNARSRKLHLAGCSSVSSMKPDNRVEFATKAAALEAGYEPCGTCRP